MRNILPKLALETLRRGGGGGWTPKRRNCECSRAVAKRVNESRQDGRKALSHPTWRSAEKLRARGLCASSACGPLLVSTERSSVGRSVGRVGHFHPMYRTCTTGCMVSVLSASSQLELRSSRSRRSGVSDPTPPPPGPDGHLRTVVPATQPRPRPIQGGFPASWSQDSL